MLEDAARTWSAKGGAVVMTALGRMADSADPEHDDVHAVQKRLLGSLYGEANPRDILRLLSLYREDGKLLLDETVTHSRVQAGQVNEELRGHAGRQNIRGVVLRPLTCSHERQFWTRALLQPFDDGDVGGAAALAHGLQAVAAARALQRVQHRGEQLGAGGAERMAEAIAPPLGLTLAGSALVSFSQAITTDANALVDLDGVDVVDRQAGLLRVRTGWPGIGPVNMNTGSAPRC